MEYPVYLFIFSLQIGCPITFPHPNNLLQSKMSHVIASSHGVSSSTMDIL